MAEFQDAKPTKLRRLRERAEEKFVQALSKKTGIPYIDLATTNIDLSALRLLSEEDAKTHNIIPFQKNNKRVMVAAREPHSDGVKTFLENLERKGYTPNLFITSTRSIHKSLGYYKDLSLAKKTEGGAIAIAEDSVSELIGEVSSVEDVAQRISQALHDKVATSRLLELTVSGALALDASDIHFEPEDEAVRLRYRLDGILVDIVDIDEKTYSFILSRVILVAGLKLNERQNAQDGRFSIKLHDKDIEMRVSIIPGNFGNSIVMRILDPDSLNATLETLGFDEHLLELIKQKISQPNGLVLNTGPTGSGKTTSLYSFLKEINEPDKKIITIEDPVEYHLEGVVQTQVDKKHDYTFLSGLRSTLRQDPDVVMVGEIRDKETAQLAIQAALTGHLVLSTIHTNDAIGVVPRLVDMGVDPYLIAPTLILAMAQRLVARRCQGAGNEVPIEGAIKKMIQKELSNIPEKYRNDMVPEHVYENAPGPDCPNGTRGRMAVTEVLKVTPKIEETILENPVDTEIEKVARDQGFLTMREDATIKALRGEIPLEEINTL